jgi:hypothetical protein
MLQNSHFVAFLSSETVGDVDHDAAHRRSNLRYFSSVIGRFTARTPLQRSRGHPIVVQISEALRSTGIRGNSTFQPEAGAGSLLQNMPSIRSEFGHRRWATSDIP